MDSRNILLTVWALQIASLVSVFFNIAFARQVLCFLFVTFFPGYLIVRICKFNNSRFSITILLSVGASILVLMLIGLLLNTLLPIFGLMYPLSTFSIVASINLFVLVSSAILWVKYPSSLSLHISRPKLLPGIILLISIPSLTAIGVEIARLGNTLVLMMLMVVISLVVLCAFSAKLIPAESYPLAILAIALSLLFHMSLISNYVIGTDIHEETYFAQLTFANSFWNRAIFHPYNAMISVTILPTIYMRYLNVDATLVFKIVYPLVFSLVPLILFYAFRKRTNSLVAFLGVFFFMSMDTFYDGMLSLARQMIGELFLALLILLIVDENVDLAKKKLLFYAFSIGLLFSHYSLAYLFLFFALAAFAVSSYFEGGRAQRMITGKFIFGYALATSVWYIFAVPAASQSLVDDLNLIYNSLVGSTFGPGPGGLLPPAISLLRRVSQYEFYLLQLFIIFGIIALVAVRKKARFNPEYAGMSVGSLLLLLMSVGLPSFAATLNIGRIYHISLFLLAPFCVLGGISVLELVANGARAMKSRQCPSVKGLERVFAHALSKEESKRTWTLLITFLLISLFLFQVGFIYKATGDNNTGSISLSMDRKNSWTTYMNQLYLDEPEVSALKWFAKHENKESRVFASYEGAEYLMSYGSVPRQRLNILENDTSPYWLGISYAFFDRLNLNNGIFNGYDALWNLTDFMRAKTPSFPNETDQIYSSGDSALYCGQGVQCR